MGRMRYCTKIREREGGATEQKKSEKSFRPGKKLKLISTADDNIQLKSRCEEIRSTSPVSSFANVTRTSSTRAAKMPSNPFGNLQSTRRGQMVGTGMVVWFAWSTENKDWGKAAKAKGMGLWESIPGA